ncbi:MAG TPA: ATP-binding cassette domain-containing protein [Myxococcaceae bacterium]|nr:ATP-binding cassette domain-containing protein [Myxococcaceae bacterium]
MSAVDVQIAGAVGAFDYEVALHLDAPAALVLAGPNGAGKSTTLKAILGAVRPERGRIAIGGADVFDAARGLDVPTELRAVGYVPQAYALFPHLTALENVAFGLRGPDRSARARAMMERLGVADLARRRPTSLSGGEQQRVALARALAPEPRLLLLDEPLAALDVVSRRQVRRFLAERLRSLEIPSIVVTHDIDDARTLGDRLAILERGRVVDSGDLTSVLQRRASPFAAELAASAFPQ